MPHLLGGLFSKLFRSSQGWGLTLQLQGWGLTLQLQGWEVTLEVHFSRTTIVMQLGLYK